jgi:quercetin dioxygenase-like cupin family protein
MGVQPKRPTVKGPSDWFTGDVYIDAIAQGHGTTPTSVAFVHFTPGARTAWHSHSVGQTLYVTEGEGRVQPRGEPVVTIRAGDVVVTPGGEWHWHGAALDHFMTHLAVSEGDADWGEQVTDTDYQVPFSQVD